LTLPVLYASFFVLFVFLERQLILFQWCRETAGGEVKHRKLLRKSYQQVHNSFSAREKSETEILWNCPEYGVCVWKSPHTLPWVTSETTATLSLCTIFTIHLIYVAVKHGKDRMMYLMSMSTSGIHWGKEW